MADGIDGRGEGPITRPGPVGLPDTGQRTVIKVPGSKQAGRLDEADKFPFNVPGHPPRSEE